MSACRDELLTIDAGERPQRARQLWRWMYYRGNWVRSLEETAGVQGGISDAFRCPLPSQCEFSAAAHRSSLSMGCCPWYSYARTGAGRGGSIRCKS